MTQPEGTCPNCGAKIVFRWSSSVQTVCEYCKSILVRTDVDLQKVGQVADLRPIALLFRLAPRALTTTRDSWPSAVSFTSTSREAGMNGT